MWAGRRSPIAALILAVVAWGCVPTATVEPSAPAPERADPSSAVFAVDPLRGFVGNIPEQSRYELTEAVAALGRGEAAVARAAAEALLDIDPTLLPAIVLLAQVELASGSPERVLELLGQPLEEHPGYTAGQLVYGRAAELQNDVVAAYGAYRMVKEHDAAALERAAALAGRARSELGARTRAAIDSGRLTAATRMYALLEVWAPEERATLDLRRLLARARGDAGAELRATRALASDGKAPLELARRQAELEMSIGDARAGLALWERLGDEYPDDSEIQGALATARFAWRTRLLPDSVAELLDRPSLQRGDFATLTFWLVPGVRSGAPGNPVIVSDIVEHPQSREIARVLSLGLMAPIDAAVRRFSPDDYMRRGAALATLLRMPARIGRGAACVGGAGNPPESAPDAVCAAALRCRLIEEPAACRPGAAISGPEAVEALRRTLHLIQ